MAIDYPGISVDHIFNVSEAAFDELALQIFAFQQKNNPVYRQYYQLRYKENQSFSAVTALPFLPISFFKTHRVASFDGPADACFISSGTTGSSTSRHWVKHLSLYENSFSKGFRYFYGNPAQYTILCLLPSYLERSGSSLAYMAAHLVSASGKPESGFFLKAGEKLAYTLEKLAAHQEPAILLGVSFALLDFAEQHPMPLGNTIVMETGGMKGRRAEPTRAALHQCLSQAFQVEKVHSEYGMTELLSQAYSTGDGLFRCPPWMRVYVRPEDDPYHIQRQGRGILCVADLANLYSCSFIETQDAGRVYADGRFEVLGRTDHSDMRGCSLLAL